MKVLIVDDEKLIVKGLVFSLEQDGYETDCAYDGGEAVDKIRSNDYDIVLLDLMLPVMDGYEVCKKVRTFSQIPVIPLCTFGIVGSPEHGLDPCLEFEDIKWFSHVYIF